MKYGWVTTNILDIKAKPDYHSERVNQILFADTFEIINSRKNYLKIQKNDGYKGYIYKDFIKPLSKKDFLKQTKNKNLVVTKLKTVPKDAKNKKIPPFILTYGTRLNGRKTSDGNYLIKLPDNSSLKISNLALEPINISMSSVKGNLLVKEARKFIGTPYLWGGLSSFGIDCSGLVQAVMNRFNINYPRDTKDQIKVGQLVEKDNIKTGDLLFFNRHVGIALDKNRFIHSSIGGNIVRINSLLKTDSDFRQDLFETFQLVRRII